MFDPSQRINASSRNSISELPRISRNTTCRSTGPDSSGTRPESAAAVSVVRSLIKELQTVDRGRPVAWSSSASCVPS